MAEREPAGLSVYERFMVKARKDPLVPFGALATVGFLLSGLYSFNKGNARLSQKLMRGRVLAQGFTVAVLFAGVTMTAKRPETKRQTAEDKLNEVRQKENIWVNEPTPSEPGSSIPKL